MFPFRTKFASAGRFGGAIALLLALGLAGCEQPQALPVAAAPLPATSAQPDRYYLNARLSSKEVVELLNPQSITRMDVLKGQQAADYAHDVSVRGVVLVQTR
ncbi:MAG TPA: hypothetical protein VFO93_00710 [Hymenobacter sp.]|uniref:hypothetical protein n=1 Tax=Hymenobacter sp. TaxID=1898978 RepID=UPI002D8026A8|nr:hypothetical protein [Hymenobacter sp.]HET9502029.1 hypothetical protein [Hymenobacter sp.]